MFIRLDDGFADDPRILALSDAAFRLHVAAICRCNRRDTGGLVMDSEATLLTGYLEDPELGPSVIAELVAAELWTVVDVHGNPGWQLQTLHAGPSSFLDALEARVRGLTGMETIPNLADADLLTRGDVLGVIQGMRR